MFLFEQLNEKVASPQQIQQSAKTQSVPAEESAPEYTDEDIDSGEEELIGQEDTIPPDLAPLRKYFLIQKLKELKDQIQDYNIQNPDLDTILKFVNNLSYNSLLLLSNGIVLSIEEQIARLTNGQTTK